MRDKKKRWKQHKAAERARKVEEKVVVKAKATTAKANRTSKEAHASSAKQAKPTKEQF